MYNLNKAFQFQRPVRKKEEEDSAEIMDFDEETWQAEQENLRREKLKKYEESLETLLHFASEKGEINLLEIENKLGENTETKERLIPNVEIFKEIMVEMIKNRDIDITALRKERSEYIQDSQGEFQLNDMLLRLTEEKEENRNIRKIQTCRITDGGTVVFQDVSDENGKRKSIRCSNVYIRVIREE